MADSRAKAGEYTICLEHLVPESKAVLKEQYGHVTRTWKLAFRDSHWLNMGQFHGQNN